MFRSLEVAVNEPALFTQPRAGVPLADGSIAFIAVNSGVSDADVSELGARFAIFVADAGGAPPRILYAGDQLVNPLDIDVSLDATTLFVADVAAGPDGGGAILALPIEGGEPVEQASGWSPRSVSAAADGKVYFSGIDRDSGAAGVFTLDADVIQPVFSGFPLVDPSGIAVFADGRVLVADTRSFDARAEGDLTSLASEASVVLIEDGSASILTSGFATGYPAGIALSRDEKRLIVSGQGADRSDTVFVVDMATPEAPPTVVTDDFSAYQDSSAGLKRAHDSDTFIWASLSANGGSIYRIVGR